MKNNKKAFTIVELVIVIAVIAILAAVLIPTFSNIIQKSKVSSDQQLIRNLNSALTTDAAVNGKHANMQSALDTAFEYGYDVTKIEAKATGNKILWDQVNDVFCYLDGDKVAYIPQSVETGLPANDYRLWVISDKVDANYSTYYIGTEASVETTKGFDAGKSAVTAITYSTTANQSVIIRTNGGTLTINAANSNISHYGEGTVLTIDAVASASYHEFGSFNMAEIKKGRLVVEENGFIGLLDASDATAAVFIEVSKVESISNVVTGDNSNVTVPTNANKIEKTEVGTESELRAAITNNDVKYILLTSNIDAKTRLTIDRDLVIDGSSSKFAISVSQENISNGRAINIGWDSSDNINVTLTNLKVVGPTSGSYTRGLNVASAGNKLILNNCEVSCNTYAINVIGKANNLNLSIDKSTISGWAALNIWAFSNKIDVFNSVLVGTNDKSESEWNNFATICFEADTTYNTSDYSYNNVVTLKNSTVKAVETNTNIQALLSFNGGDVGATSCHAEVINCELVEARYTLLPGGQGNSVNVDGELVWSN